MPETLNCLESLVGLTPDALPCFPLPTVGLLDWINTSSRTGSPGGGVYISQLAGLSFQPAKSDPAQDVYLRLAKARTAAAQDVRTRIQQAAKYSFGVANFITTGTLGKLGAGAVYPGGAVLPLLTSSRDSGGYRVTALGLVTTTTVLDIPIYLDGVLVSTLASTNAGTQPLPSNFSPQFGGGFAGSFIIPFDGQQHTLTATLPAGVSVLDTKLYCPPCNSNNPFGQAVARNLYNINSQTPSGGFILQVAEACLADTQDVLCFATTAGPEIADSLAYAVRSMAGYFFLLDLYSNAQYSRYTLLDQKQMLALGQAFKAHGDETIAWLSQPTGLGRLKHPCFTCALNPYGPRLVKTA